MSSYRIVILVSAVVALAFVFALFNAPVFSDKRDTANNTSTSTRQCDTAAKTCPDGSVVTRAGPICQFQECPVVATSTEQIHAKDAVLRGTVTISPTCPVERTPPDPSCAPRPYDTEVFALRKDTGAVVAQTHTTDGEYVLDLPAGEYTIRAKSALVYPQCPDAHIGLANHDKQTLNISCDSGIR